MKEKDTAVREEAVVEETVAEETAVSVVVNTNDLASAVLIEGLANPKSMSFYCSVKNDGSRSARIKIYNSISSADEDLSDHKGEVLEIVDVAGHTVKIADEKTGEIKDCARVILIDKDGVAYQCVSEGVASSMQRIFNIVGMPDEGAWYNEPLKVKAVERKTNKGFKVMTLDLIV